MIVGLAYDLKSAVAQVQAARTDDAFEEYDSPETVESIGVALRSLGLETLKLGGGRLFLESVLHDKVDFVFNISEGVGTFRSREAQVPAVLEMLGIPYTGSDPQCLAVCLDKPLTKNLVSQSGVSVPFHRLYTSIEEVTAESGRGLQFPLFVKPAYEGSSKGIRFSSKVDTLDLLRQVVVAQLESYRQPIMAEQYIAGREVTVGLIGNTPTKVVGIMEVVPRSGAEDFAYTLEVKRDWEKLVEYRCPADFPPSVFKRIEQAALAAFRILGCQDFSRVDFRLSPEGVPYFLEINPLPGLNPHSGDLPIMSRLMGWTYQELVAAVFNAARQRCL